MNLIKDYTRLILFAVGLLIGIQVPGFVDQYTKRVDAHLIEASNNLETFQGDADKYFSGSFTKLIQHYRSSDDPVVRDGAASVSTINDRVSLFTTEIQALEKSWLSAIWHIAFSPNREIFRETLNVYSYSVIFNVHAIIWGICCGVLFALLIDLVTLIMKSVFRRLLPIRNA